jgi:hypothetical protein
MPSILRNPNIRIGDGLSNEAQQNLIKSFDDAVSLVKQLENSTNLESHSFRLAKMSALQTTNALLMAVAARCTKVNPPADLEIINGDSGDLVYRCFHDPAHDYDLDGKQLP